MSTFVPGRVPLSDIQQPIGLYLRDYVKAHWACPTVNISRIKFGVTWWDGFTSIQIHFRDLMSPSTPINLTQQMQYVADTVEVHIFVRKLSHGVQPTELSDVTEEISRIVMVNRRGMDTVSSVNSNFMQTNAVRDDRVPLASTETLYHRTLVVEVRYWTGTDVP